MLFTVLSIGETHSFADADHDQRVESLRESSFPIRSIDPADDNFSDLRPLLKIIGNCRFVIMSEATHDDGATFQARTRLIKFLHRALEFDVVAHEHETLMGMRDLETSMGTEEGYARFIQDHSTRSIVVKHRALLDFVHSTHFRRDRPIALLGFDLLYVTDLNLNAQLHTIINRMPVRPLTREQADRLERILGRITAGQLPDTPLSAKEAAECNALLAVLSKRFEEQAAMRHAAAADDVAFSRLLLRSLPAFVGCMTALDSQGIFDADRSRDQLNARDKAMAEMVLSAAHDLYRGRKMIICGANSHLLRRSADFEPMSGITSMGEHLHRALGDRLYTIVFDCYAGRWGPRSQLVPRASPKTLSHLFRLVGDRFRFLDLRGLPETHWLRKQRLGVRATGYLPDGELAVWPNIVDGILYIDEMQPVRPVRADESTGHP